MYKIPVAACPLHGANESIESAYEGSVATGSASKKQRVQTGTAAEGEGAEGGGGGREVVLPLPYEALDTAPYVGADGQFLHQPYFHDTAEVFKTPQLVSHCLCNRPNCLSHLIILILFVCLCGR
jgi:hypothetical protein